MEQVKTTGNDMDDFDDAELEELYSWIDGIPLSRPKRNIARDFSDGGKYDFLSSRKRKPITLQILRQRHVYTTNEK